MNNRKIFLTSVLGLDFDLPLLKHFLEHYISLGIKPENFLLVLNCFKNINNLKEAAKILKDYGIKPRDIWTSEYESVEKWNRINRLLEQNVNENDWVIHPDFDEFHVYPKDLNSIVGDFEKDGINAVQGVLIDRVADDGKIIEVQDDQTVWEQFPVKTSFSKLLHISGVKLMMYRGHLRANNGSGQIHNSCKKNVKYPYGNKSLHEYDSIKILVGDFGDRRRKFEPGEFIKNKDLWEKYEKDCGFVVHHFKWTGMIIEKLSQRVETYKRLNRAQWSQSQSFLDYYSKNNKILT